MEVTEKKERGFYDFLKENYEPEGFVAARFSNLDNEIIVSLERKKRQALCPECKKTASIETLRKKMIRDLDLIKKCYLEFEQAKIRCKCGYRGVEKLDFLGKHSMYTQRFEEFVSRLTEIMSISDVAGICGINWKTAQKLNNGRKRTD